MRVQARAAGVIVACAVPLTGCTNPDAVTHGSRSAAVVSPGGRGEPHAPPPTPPEAQLARAPRASPRQALQAFAGVYANWSYETLAGRQRLLAAMSVGSARAAEQQAAASTAADPTIRRGQIRNSGRVIAVAPDTIRPGYWVVATLERTAGNTQYQGLPSGYHVTLASVTKIHGGYAVSEWLPQS